MDWAEHDEWACPLGISDEVSREVNTIIDAVARGKKIPVKYKSAVEGCSQDWTVENAPDSKSAMDKVISNYSAREHDVERSSKTGGDIAAEVHLCAMQKMGDDYETAWYLHHHLDFLSENWSDEGNIDGLMEEYREQHPLTHSSEIEAYLRENKERLRRDLDQHQA